MWGQAAALALALACLFQVEVFENTLRQLLHNSFELGTHFGSHDWNYGGYQCPSAGIPNDSVSTHSALGRDHLDSGVNWLFLGRKVT